MRAWTGFVAALAVMSFAPDAQAGSTLERVRAQKVLRCGGVERPGLVDIEANGAAHGLELDLCRALASVALGPDGRLEFTRYDSEVAFAAARAGHEDVMFLTGRELVEHGLAGQVIPGPSIFVETTSVIVQDNMPYRHLDELADKPICYAQGPHAEYHLQNYFAARKLRFVPMGFQEDVELNDAYKVRYCHAFAGEATALAEVAHSPEMAGKPSHFLPETLAAYPIVATTPMQDGEWAALVAWTVETLKRADAPESYWVRGGVASMPVDAPALGLDKGWQKKLVDLVGGYGQMFDHNLGAQSELKLERGLNASVGEQGAFATPYVE